MSILSGRWIQTFQRLPGVRSIVFWWVDRHYRRWHRVNPDADYGKFYAERIASQIAAGRPHPTLGPKSWKDGRTIALDQAEFARRGANNWRYYVVAGVKPSDRVVDYGCGSLRLGQHAIAMLDPGNYWGLDVTDEFYRQGLALIDPAIVAEKRPRLSVISAETLAQVRQWSPTFIFSNAVLQHVPPAERRGFLAQVASLLVVGATALLIFVEGPDGDRYKGMNWAYSGDALIETIDDLDDEVEGSIEDIGDAGTSGRATSRRWLKIRRPGG